jgi:glucokinase
MADVGRHLGSAVGGFVNVFDPEAVVIGGGLSHAWDLFGTAMRAAAGEVIMSPEQRRHLRIVPGEFPDDAGLLGAAAWARDRLGDTC